MSKSPIVWIALLAVVSSPLMAGQPEARQADVFDRVTHGYAVSNGGVNSSASGGSFFSR